MSQRLHDNGDRRVHLCADPHEVPGGKFAHTEHAYQPHYGCILRLGAGLL